MPAGLNLKPEEVDTPEKRAAYRVGVIGCGQRGIFYSMAFAEAGFKVTCADADQSLIRLLSKASILRGDREAEGKLKRFVRTEQITATSDLKKAVAQSDVIILAFSPKIDEKKSPDYSETESTCKQVGAALQKGSLVIYAGIAGFGLTEGLVKETLENTSGLKAKEDFGLAYNPIQYAKLLGSQELKVAAKDKVSLNSAGVFFETIAKKGVKRIPDVKTAELATLFAAVKRDADAALANELAAFCENASIDYVETLKLLNGETNETVTPPTITEEDNRKEAYLLLESAENLNAKLRLPTLARQINEDMIRHAANLTQEALRNGEKTLRRARIALLGTVEPESAAAAFIELIEAKGAKIRRYDPQGSVSESPEASQSIKRTLNETVEGTDCVVILNGQELKRLNLKKLRALMKSPAALIDLAGIVEPSKVEDAGFTYRGLGRGAWKK